MVSSDEELESVHYRFITRPSPEETDQIRALYKAEGWWAARDDESPDLISRIIHGSHCFLIALSGGRIIGMARAVSDRTSDAYLQDVTVAADRRGKGLGSEIVQRIVARLHEDGLQWIGLIAERGSHPFYERLGFQVMPASLPMLRKEAS